MVRDLLRFGSELPLHSINGELGVQDGVLGSDRPPRGSGCREEPGGMEQDTANLARVSQS